jgi:hypothetical protein
MITNPKLRWQIKACSGSTLDKLKRKFSARSPESETTGQSGQGCFEMFKRFRIPGKKEIFQSFVRIFKTIGLSSF